MCLSLQNHHHIPLSCQRSKPMNSLMSVIVVILKLDSGVEHQDWSATEV
jgi:hypothetical protein